MDSKAEKGLNLGAAFFNLYTVSQNSYFVHMSIRSKPYNGTKFFNL